MGVSDNEYSGNGDLTYDEAKSHFTAWALMKSPLLVGTDVGIARIRSSWNLLLRVLFQLYQLSRVTHETLEILMNREIITINQDPVVGTSISPFRWGLNVSVQSCR